MTSRRRRGLNHLADACALVTYHGRGAASMNEAGRPGMEEGDVFVSPITVWEITHKAAMGSWLAQPPRLTREGFPPGWTVPAIALGMMSRDK
jgi:hypothetical protein